MRAMYPFVHAQTSYLLGFWCFGKVRKPFVVKVCFVTGQNAVNGPNVLYIAQSKGATHESSPEIVRYSCCAVLLCCPLVFPNFEIGISRPFFNISGSGFGTPPRHPQTPQFFLDFGVQNP